MADKDLEVIKKNKGISKTYIPGNIKSKALPEKVQTQSGCGNAETQHGYLQITV